MNWLIVQTRMGTEVKKGASARWEQQASIIK